MDSERKFRFIFGPAFCPEFGFLTIINTCPELAEGVNFIVAVLLRIDNLLSPRRTPMQISTETV